MTVKEQVLQLLEEHRDTYLSGEDMALSLQVSRNAVWKSIQSLRKEGYEILSGTNRGYCLIREGDNLSADKILKFYKQKSTGTIQPTIHIYDTLSSTNQEAVSLANAGAPTGTTVIANAQSQGRGHKEHAFHSPAGGIYMSVIFRPKDLLLPKQQHYLMTAFGAASTLRAITEETDITPEIKWVNDLFYNGRKLCGILTEAGTDFESGDLTYLVVGIGINFSTPMDAFSKQLQEQITSLYPLGQPNITRNQLIGAILRELLPPHLGQEPLFQPPTLMDYYRSHLYRPQASVWVQPQEGAAYPATLKSVDDNCHAIIEKEDGTTSILSYRSYSLRYCNNMPSNRS